MKWAIASRSGSSSSTARRRAGCPAAECVFIDDLPANIEGAKRCGWQGIVYTDFADLKRRLAELGVV